MPSVGHLAWKPSVKFLNFLFLRVNIFSFFSIAPALVYVSARVPVKSNLGCGYLCLYLPKKMPALRAQVCT